MCTQRHERSKNEYKDKYKYKESFCGVSTFITEIYAIGTLGFAINVSMKSTDIPTVIWKCVVHDSELSYTYRNT